MYRTGGGSSNAPEFTDIEEKVISICSNIKGLETRHDSDTIQSVPTSISDITLLDIEQIRPVDTEEPNIAEDTALDISVNLPDMEEEESFNFDFKTDNGPQKENKWDKWHPKALKSRVSNVLKPDTINKASVSSKLDRLSSARLDLVQLQMETARKEQEFKEEEHRLKMEHLANDEKRNQEIHVLLLQKLKSAPVGNVI